MGGYIKAVALSIGLLIPVTILMSLFGGPLGVALFLMWAIVTGLLVYMEVVSGKDPLIKLRKAPKAGMFQKQVQQLCTSYMSVYSWRDHQKDYDAESSIYKSYDLIASQMDNIIESATKYIKTYDYYSRPTPSYLNDLVRQSKGLVERLHELQDLILKVDDSTSDVDITYVDDLLEALRDMRD